MMIKNKKASLSVFVLIVFWVVFTSQERSSEAIRFGNGGCRSSCYMQEVAENRRPKNNKNLNPEGYSRADDEDGDNGYSDYDFYRKHGDVPSPGMGH
ncbi:hypothetical protein BT93_J0762 [Corymbia citriodora subsp. variegata]|nr:hypothetical protein BT93_J0762 [Corymbia citriodora subsp. variegata]